MPSLSDSRSYLENLPESENNAKKLLAWGEDHLKEFNADEKYPLHTVRLLEPVEIIALFDFGLTPKHLKNSASVIGLYEKGLLWLPKPRPPRDSRNLCRITKAT
jgi:hypothetical protein